MTNSHLSAVRQFIDPYWRLTRMDRPIGIYLLLWPTLSALWLAADGWPGWHLLFVFSLGTILMRAAGCAINDYADRNIDAHVSRTKTRPLATGALTPRSAIWAMAALAAVAFLLVLTLNQHAILLSFAGLAIALIYPFAKRVTHWPQAVLGLAFSFGIPMAFAAVQEQVSPLAWSLFALNFLWTISYDTMYAMSDRPDDIKIGVRSTAILFGQFDVLIVMSLLAVFLTGWACVGYVLGLGWPFWVGFFAACIGCVRQYQMVAQRQRGPCLAAFLSNHWVGLALFLGLVGTL